MSFIWILYSRYKIKGRCIINRKPIVKPGDNKEKLNISYISKTPAFLGLLTFSPTMWWGGSWDLTYKKPIVAALPQFLGNLWAQMITLTWSCLSEIFFFHYVVLCLCLCLSSPITSSLRLVSTFGGRERMVRWVKPLAVPCFLIFIDSTLQTKASAPVMC